MPIIEVVDDDESNEEINSQSLGELVLTPDSIIKVPKEFHDPSYMNTNAAVVWREAASMSLKKILISIQKSDELELKEFFVPLIEIVAPFTGSGAWVQAETRKVTREILSVLGTPSQGQIRAVLLQAVKPAFDRATHNEQLNTETATRISRPSNLEPMYHADEDSVWKESPGLVDIILWCLDSLQEYDWETLWPLLIPPVLTYMDDWEIVHRLHGITLCRRLVSKAPPSIITRTGIDQLMRASLETSLLRLSDAESPIIFKEAMVASLELVEKTTKPGSSDRYQRLFALLGDSIIGGAWMYGYREALLIQATYEILPVVLDALGIACVRYLKAMIPQLLHTIIPAPEREVSTAMLEASLQALRKTVQIGSPRMAYWSGEIVSGVVKCWLSLDSQQSDEIKRLLIEVLRDLKNACPEIFQEHTQVLRNLDEEKFAPLIALAE